jgi:hypothetical protein
MIANAVGQAGSNFVDALALFLPRILTTISIVLVGWLIAVVLKGLVRFVLRSVRINAAAERTGVAEVLKTVEMPAADLLIASIFFWLVWFGFIISGIDALGFAVLEGLADDFAAFVPRLLVGFAILIVGFLAATFLWRATLLAAINARIPSPRLLAGAVRALVLILASAMALDHVALARSIVLTAFAIAFGSVMLGLAIAFGIGGGDMARRVLENQFPERDRSGVDDVTHL